MNDFTSFGEAGKRLSDLGLGVRQTLLTLDEARTIDSFKGPVTLYHKWLGLPGDIPNHRDITPAFLGPALLPLMYITDVVKDDPDRVDFRWRLFGTTHSERYGAEATGILMSEAAERDASAAGSYKVAQQVYATGEPAFFLTEFLDDNELVTKTTSTVVLPLSNKAGDLVRLFGCSVWA